MDERQQTNARAAWPLRRLCGENFEIFETWMRVANNNRVCQTDCGVCLLYAVWRCVFAGEFVVRACLPATGNYPLGSAVGFIHSVSRQLFGCYSMFVDCCLSGGIFCWVVFVREPLFVGGALPATRNGFSTMVENTVVFQPEYIYIRLWCCGCDANIYHTNILVIFNRHHFMQWWTDKICAEYWNLSVWPPLRLPS